MLFWLPTLLQYQLVAFIDTGAHAMTVAENIVSISYENVDLRAWCEQIFLPTLGLQNAFILLRITNI